MTGWALLLFAVFLLADRRERVGGCARTVRSAVLLPFTIYGMNALFIFAFSGFVAKMLGFIKFAQANGSTISLKAPLYAPLQVAAARAGECLAAVCAAVQRSRCSRSRGPCGGKNGS